jgi:hypothetical protein
MLIFKEYDMATLRQKKMTEKRMVDSLNVLLKRFGFGLRNRIPTDNIPVALQRMKDLMPVIKLPRSEKKALRYLQNPNVQKKLLRACRQETKKFAKWSIAEKRDYALACELFGYTTPTAFDARLRSRKGAELRARLDAHKAVYSVAQFPTFEVGLSRMGQHGKSFGLLTDHATVWDRVLRELTVGEYKRKKHAEAMKKVAKPVEENP